MLDPPPRPKLSPHNIYLKMILILSLKKRGCKSEFLFSFLKMYGFQREDISCVMKKKIYNLYFDNGLLNRD